jgi:hypothetical protein
MLVLAGVALGSTSGKQTTAGKARIAIKERGSAALTSDKTLKGRFSLTLNGVIEDSGTTVIRPNQGNTKTVGGQQQTPVFGYDNLTSKKGTLSLSFSGIDITINNIDPTKGVFDIESGTWQINRGSGIYKGWKGGGRWANVGTAAVNIIEWDGYITR